MKKVLAKLQSLPDDIISKYLSCASVYPRLTKCFLLNCAVTPLVVFLVIALFLHLPFFPIQCKQQWNAAIPFVSSPPALSLPGEAPQRPFSDSQEVEHGTIFVTVGSYRDPECVHTILAIFNSAQFPDRIRVGLFSQLDVKLDVDCMDFKRAGVNCEPDEYAKAHDNDIRKLIRDAAKSSQKHEKSQKNEKSQKSKKDKGDSEKKEKESDSANDHYYDSGKLHPICGREWQVKVARVDGMSCLGPTYARYRAEQFYAAEDFALQIDSHTAFIQNWDSVLIEMFHAAHNDFAVLSTYPKPTKAIANFKGHSPGTNPKRVWVICQTEIQKNKFTKSFKHRAASSIPKPESGTPLPMGAFFAAGFSFAKGHRILRVPYDPYTPFLFDGEEISMTLRLFTHGYDVYIPSRDVCYHLYTTNAQHLRPLFWEVDWAHRSQIAQISELRINHILGLDKQLYGNEQRPAAHSLVQSRLDLREADKYSLGKQRTLLQYMQFAKIDLKEYTSENLCPIIQNGKGGMLIRRVPWNDTANDPLPSKS